MNRARIDLFYDCKRTLELFSDRVRPYGSQEERGCSRHIIRILLRNGLIEKAGKWQGRITYRITVAGFKVRDEGHILYLTRRHKRRFQQIDKCACA